MGNGGEFELSQEVLAALPSDPYEQLDVARRITAMAVATRMSKLEQETGKLRQKLTEKELVIHGLQERVAEVEATLEETNARFSQSMDEQTKLLNDKNALGAHVKKLQRDVAKLETFKRTLMQSLQEEDEHPSGDGGGQTPNMAIWKASQAESTLTKAHIYEDDSQYPKPSRKSGNYEDDSQYPKPSRKSGNYEDDSQYPKPSRKSGNYEDDSQYPRTSRKSENYEDEAESMSGSKLEMPKQDTSPKHLQGANSARGNPALRQPRTPTGSPKPQPTKGSPLTSMASLDSQLHIPPSQPTSRSSSPSHSGQSRTTRLDGKEFFRQARSRLSYEQFSSFLANIKELNAHRQTREETLGKAEEIFGPENRDLYSAFEGILSRHLPT